MGGMAAQIPVKGDDARQSSAAFAKVRADKEREANNGHDGTWVAHPDLVPDRDGSVQSDDADSPTSSIRRATMCTVTGADLHRRCTRASPHRRGPAARMSASAFNIIEAWLRGRGAVPLYNLMEDAATAEISRAQIWQWIQQAATLDDGRVVTGELFSALLDEEMAPFNGGRFPEAIQLFSTMSLAPDFQEFLTLPAYEVLEH